MLARRLTPIPAEAFILAGGRSARFGSNKARHLIDGVPMVAKGLEDVSRLPNLTKALVARGYSDREIEKILGGNFLRVIDRVCK